MIDQPVLVRDTRTLGKKSTVAGMNARVWHWVVALKCDEGRQLFGKIGRHLC